MYYAEIRVMYKKGVLDPQGQAVKGALHHLGFSKVNDVSIGRVIFLKLEAQSKEEAQKTVREMCESLLANPVIEDFTYTIMEEEK
ncbi:phosphoribosylformylglycinamidine synthase subunit PurS [Thermovenabulum gondwanense]|uniref:Phosphoribosylformylglycinamidine synthase subunit PurS n=1 Tax=Thermovenabulum gondwanense TaxID=520767 RepID=A0A162MJG7_9FIRM|nr:phosphoribosylformylglycinamidine synthase subunit PurS [Thermovenabulum gondwanense]KYO66363.1 Phosphoribosylformylglycinamidine synthase subunit PurS [Thermovenabulum gondwanense]